MRGSQEMCSQEMCSCREVDNLALEYEMWKELCACRDGDKFAIVCMERGGKTYHILRAVDRTCVHVERGTNLP